MTRTEKVELLRKMADDERMKAYVWEAISEIISVKSLADSIPATLEYAGGKVRHLMHSSVSHSIEANKLEEI